MTKITDFPENTSPQAADLVAIVGNPASAAATQRATVQNLFTTVLNARHHGCIGNGTTDDSSALQAMVDLMDATHNSIYFPPGRYLIASQITKDFTSNNKDIVIYGDGDAVTQLIGSNASGIFAFTVDGDTQVNVSGLSFVPSGTSRGTALDLSYTGSTNNFMSVKIRDCSFGALSASDSTSNYFTKCIQTGGASVNIGSGVIDSCFFQGKSATDPDSTVGISLELANDITISKCQFYNCLQGVLINSFDTEGLVVVDSFFVRCKTGIFAHASTASRPYIEIANTHIAYSKTGIDLKNYIQVFIHDCLLQTRSDSTETTTTDILIDTGANSSIHDNTFTLEVGAVTTQRGIVLRGANVRQRVHDNQINDRDQCIRLEHVASTFTTLSWFSNNRFNNVLTSGGEYSISADGHDNEFQGGITTDQSEIVTATNVIVAPENGTTFYLNAAGGFVSTLPKPEPGLHYTFIVQTALSGGTCTVVTNSSANIMNVLLLDIVGELVYATARDVVTFTDGCLVGARLEVETDGTTWFCKAFAGADADITTGQTA